MDRARARGGEILIGGEVVNDVRPSTLPTPALKPTFSGPQHLITLSSVEYDGLGDVTTLAEPEVVEKLIEQHSEQAGARG